MPSRPARVKLKNERGKSQTLPEGKNYFESIGQGSRHIFFGLGPDPKQVAEIAGVKNDIYYLECPYFSEQMPANWHQDIPSNLIAITPKQLNQNFFQTCTFWIYTPNLRLFPSFWAPLKARILKYFFNLKTANNKNIFIGGGSDSLIIPEISQAFAGLGYTCLPIKQKTKTSDLGTLIQKHNPLFMLSLNMHGLDAYGQNIALLKEMDIPVAIWCVDNPMHILSACKSELWNKAVFLVTDDWFIPTLEQYGVKTYHLPLATAPDIFKTNGNCQTMPGTYFVGSSSFVDKNKFFAGCTLEEDLIEEARTKLSLGQRPDLSWWIDKQGLPKSWDDPKWRNIGFAAESCSQSLRASTLSELSKHEQVNIIGDSNWTRLVPLAKINPAIDYYRDLPQIYSQAEFSLNLTSLLLPQGLTQRHFDTWVANGFLLTDATPGLKIFPSYLAKPVSFKTPKEAKQKIDIFRKDRSLKQDIKKAWTKEILARHTYTHRSVKILNILNIKK